MKTTIRTQMLEVNAWAAAALDGLMRIYQTSRRVAFKCLRSGVGLNELRRELAQLFPELNARYRNDAILQAGAIITSQRELLPRRLAEVEAKIVRTKRKLARAQDPVRRRGIMVRLDKLEGKKQALRAHLERNTIPKVIFGKRSNFVLRRRGLLSREAWRGLRTRAFYSRGEKHRQGNQHARLRYEEVTGQFHLRIGFPQTDGRCRYQWFPLQVPNKERYRELLLTASQGEEAYSVEVLRQRGRYYAHITVEENVSGKIVRNLEAERVSGVDLNLDRVAVGVSDRQGQYRGSKTYHRSLLADARQEKRNWVIGNLAREIVADLIGQDVGGLVLEELDIKQTHDTNARFNRRTVNFVYRRLHEAIVREALRTGLEVKLANPAYSSVMGRLKYAGPYGISDHEAAAYVLARRGLGLRERLPKPLVGILPTLVEELDSLIPSSIGQAHEKAVRWQERLADWHRYSPRESDHPWLLWATIDGVCKLIKRQLTWSNGEYVVAGMVGVTGG